MAERPMLQLVHDVLDAQLLDQREEKIGRADELVLELGSEGPPRVSAILIGGDIRARRIGAWMLALRRLAGALHALRASGVSRVSFDDVREIGDCVKLDVDEGSLASERLERWLRKHVVCRIPGAEGEMK